MTRTARAQAPGQEHEERRGHRERPASLELGALLAGGRDAGCKGYEVHTRLRLPAVPRVHLFTPAAGRAHATRNPPKNQSGILRNDEVRQRVAGERGRGALQWEQRSPRRLPAPASRWGRDARPSDLAGRGAAAGIGGYTKVSRAPPEGGGGSPRSTGDCQAHVPRSYPIGLRAREHLGHAEGVWMGR